MNDSLTTKRVTVLSGDGVGPEVVQAATSLVEATGAPIEWEYADAGGVAFDKGIESGVPQETIDSISRNRTVLKGPLATPIGHGQKSANVTLRKLFETFANIRPARELPGVTTPFSGRGVDFTIVRENVEDLYAGIEHMQTPNVAQCLKLISRLGSQRVAQAAFAWARSESRGSVTVATKSNIMKLTEGMFHREFQNVAKNYPDIEAGHLLVDNAAHQMVIAPEKFEVLVTTNMNGDILSDLASGIVGGLGVAPSANIGYEVQMFEAVHGTAPDIAGHDRVNPTAMILSAIMMLRHLELFAEATQLEQALFVTLEEGIHTADLRPAAPVGTKAFADAVGERLGQRATTSSKEFRPFELPVVSEESTHYTPASREQWGVDVFIETGDSPEVLGRKLEEISEGTGFSLSMVSNRGTAVWPVSSTGPTCVDHYRCRFHSTSPTGVDDAVLGLLGSIAPHYRWMHVEKLETVDGEAAFTKAQGQN